MDLKCILAVNQAGFDDDQNSMEKDVDSPSAMLSLSCLLDIHVEGPSRQLSVQNQGSGWRPVYVYYNMFGSHGQVESISSHRIG